MKLAAPLYCSNSSILIVDSDAFFVERFNESCFVPRGGGKYLLRREAPELSDHTIRARELLGLPPQLVTHHYVFSPAILHQAWLTELHGYLERLYRRPWQETLLYAGNFSEYCLYGTFVEEILKPPDLVLRYDGYGLGLWRGSEFATLTEFRALVRQLISEARRCGALSVTVQSVIGVRAHEYASTVFEVLNSHLDH